MWKEEEKEAVAIHTLQELETAVNVAVDFAVRLHLSLSPPFCWFV